MCLCGECAHGSRRAKAPLCVLFLCPPVACVPPCRMLYISWGVCLDWWFPCQRPLVRIVLVQLLVSRFVTRAYHTAYFTRSTNEHRLAVVPLQRRGRTTPTALIQPRRGHTVAQASAGVDGRCRWPPRASACRVRAPAPPIRRTEAVCRRPERSALHRQRHHPPRSFTSAGATHRGALGDATRRHRASAAAASAATPAVPLPCT